MVGESTSPMEWNMKKNNEFKKRKYTQELLPSMKNDVPVVIQPFEISARGVVGESIREFLDLKCFKFKNAASKRMVNNNAATIAVLCSLEIYKNRDNKGWIPRSPKDKIFPIKMSRAVRERV